MAVQFAEVSDLERKLGVSIPADEQDRADAALESASDYLRSVIGQTVYPSSSVTLNLYQYAGDEWLTIPVRPVTALTAVSVDGVALDELPALIDNSIRICGPATVSITCTYGATVVPAELLDWCCVLAQQQLSTVAELGTLASGDVQSFGIETYSKSWFQSNETGGPFSLPPGVAARLRARYGTGGATVVGTR